MVIKVLIKIFLITQNKEQLLIECNAVLILK